MRMLYLCPLYIKNHEEKVRFKLIFLGKNLGLISFDQ